MLSLLDFLLFLNYEDLAIIKPKNAILGLLSRNLVGWKGVKLAKYSTIK